jgi:vesicle-fusing ATPase
MIGFGEQEKVQYIKKAFSDAYKSPQSVVIIDDIDRIIEWVALVTRFSNNILQVLMNYVSEQPPSVSHCHITFLPEVC